MKSIICPYCNEQAPLTMGKQVYPHRPDLWDYKFFACFPCDATVGVHKHSEVPLGRLANKSLRQAKMRAHAAFDPLWKSKRMTRSQAYAWLAFSLKMTPKDCHIGMFNDLQCDAVVSAVHSHRESTKVSLNKLKELKSNGQT